MRRALITYGLLESLVVTVVACSGGLEPLGQPDGGTTVTPNPNPNPTVTPTATSTVVTPPPATDASVPPQGFVPLCATGAQSVDLFGAVKPGTPVDYLAIVTTTASFEPDSGV